MPGRRAADTVAAVSVVIATNRASRYLPEALASVAGQTFSDWELIVVDDGSPRPDELSRLIADAPEHRLVRQPAAGVSVARNHGASLARGEFLAFLDDDDLWAPHRLAAQVAALRSNPAAILCYSGGWHVDGRGTRLGEWPAERVGRDRMLGGKEPLPRFQTIVWRRMAFQRCGGFNSALTMCEDHDLTLRALQLGPFCAVDAPLAAYRRHDHNTSNVARADICRASETYLIYQLAAARYNAAQSGAWDDARLLAENLRRSRRWGVGQSAREMVEAVIGHTWVHAWRNLCYCALRGPLRGALAAGRETVAQSRRAASRKLGEAPRL